MTKAERKAAKKASRARLKAPARAVAVVNGEPWRQCGACLEWRPKKIMVDVHDTDVCPKCAGAFKRPLAVAVNA